MIENHFYEKEQAELMDQWENLSLTDSFDRQSSVQAAEKASKQTAENGVNMDGLLQIPKLELKMPILKGATNENLKHSVATVFSDEEAGVGNYSIAGHRSYTYGKHFNRLAEMKKDDFIYVMSDGVKYTYKVKEKFRVKPEEVDVLDTKDDKNEVTLITCSPARNPTHRLIVKGDLVHKTDLK